MSSQSLLIAVVGAGNEQDSRLLTFAEAVGRCLADQGHILITGGRGGIMEAASAGASAGGGIVVGILPGGSRGQANRFVQVPIATGLGEARNAIIAAAAQAVIAVGGEYGTLSEVALALKLGKPVVGFLPPWTNLPDLQIAASPEDAVQLAVSCALQSSATENS